MVEKHRVNGFAHGIIAAKRKAHVRDATADFCAGQVLFDPTRGVDEIDRVVVVLFNARGNGKNIGVKNDVFRCKAHLIHQDAVRAFADFNFSFVSVGLTFFIERHHHRRCTVTFDQFGLALEFVYAFFHADRVDNALALDATQARLNDRPLGRINHHRHARDVGLTRHEV